MLQEWILNISMLCYVTDRKKIVCCINLSCIIMQLSNYFYRVSDLPTIDPLLKEVFVHNFALLKVKIDWLYDLLFFVLMLQCWFLCNNLYFVFASQRVTKTIEKIQDPTFIIKAMIASKCYWSHKTFITFFLVVDRHIVDTYRSIKHLLLHFRNVMKNVKLWRKLQNHFV